MNAVVEVETVTMVPARSANPTAEVVAHAKTVQQVMQAVMKPNVHYGAIPGAGDKPTLLKSGAEVLCMTFRIADRYEVTDLSRDGSIRYRVNCIGEHQTSGATLGSGLGECSSDEEKYRWRKAVCAEEFESTPETHRRMKFGRKQGGYYTVQQVRTESADLANTVLKMACKRAKIAMVLNVTAASDMFSQDLEDLDAELVRHLVDDERQAQVQLLRDEWCTKAKAAANRDALSKVMKEGVKVFQSAKDRDGYATFAAAVQARGAELKES
ncbi:hypothetical protein [Delftia acidovorans]|uniref:Uncharacterized protein n=1 Tax=Delftia acidovorans TaxID=80866 RepID=A0AAJ2VCZ2_DELAC|nr:hypothetical protein [Delftia acidovorans]MDX4957871.1 hypothetical protein [Delftia acidovorans]